MSILQSATRRAGLKPSSAGFSALLSAIISSSAISIFGFYCHSGHAYVSTSLPQAGDFLTGEVRTVNEAAGKALELISSLPNASLSHHQQPFTLSIGSTPTAHAASAAETQERLAKVLNGKLELHAGNYPFLDLQQVHTSLADIDSVAYRILSTVISKYPGRGADGVEDEAMCDAGGIAMAKDQGPIPGYGWVTTKGCEEWMLGRLSQEHGILTKKSGKWQVDGKGGELRLGQVIEIVGQHSCMTAAAYPWYYVVDSKEGDGKTVVDVWVPWKGW
jgi:D-serine deaminase-like pyridoxal phosphate-dependent protein